jgi:hydrogenase nickel incorporation protein HypA/HybF
MLVRLAVGELTHLEPEQLSFCYGAITAETPLEGSSLEIEKVDAAVQCPHCAYRGRPKYWDELLADTRVVTLCCPQCGRQAEAIQGHECAIKSVRYREETPA